MKLYLSPPRASRTVATYRLILDTVTAWMEAVPEPQNASMSTLPVTMAITAITSFGERGSSRAMA